ncbi:MAG: SpoIIE family protein phosphatase [Enterocloster clostridioformis]|nr:SpoIIE family protein phosphatase [Enterocloster clostridioformis]
MEKNGQLTKDDGLAAMQASAALVCENCSRCNLYADSEKEDSYYLYYLLRAFEQKGHIDFEDMPQMFQSGCRKKEDYLAQLNRSLGRATMNLSWKNRFLESRDAVISQFRELSAILEEFSRQIDRARDITDEYEYILKKHFRRYHVALGNLLLLEYENGQKEAFLTVRTTNGRCITSKDAALIMGEVMDGTRWSPAKDSRSIITKQYETVRFLEEGGYRMLYGASRIPKKGEKYSGDNYTFCESPGNQVVMSLSDGMGSGEAAARESKQVVELTEQLLETGFSPRAALKLVNTVLLLAGPEQHPATLDLSCIDLHTGVLEAMKLGAVPTFIIGEEGVEIMEAGEVPMGILNGVEPVLMSRKLWEGDRIVMVSDGVLDALPGDDKEQAMQQYLESVEEMGPQELADQVLDFAVSFIPAPRDDMTVLAAGIWKRRS